MSMQALRSATARTLRGAGGVEIAVADWPGVGAPLVCVPGLTANSRAFAGLANELTDARVVSMDCRGRGRSTKQVPYGIDLDADDVLAVINDLGVQRAILIGHSLGAYVVTDFAARYPDRVERLVLVDGGYWSDQPAEDPETLLHGVLGVYLARLTREWASLDEFIDYYRSSTVYRGRLDDYAEPQLAYELVGAPPAMRSDIDFDCISGDWADVLDGPATVERLRTITAPVLLLRAPGGLTGTGDEVVPDPLLAAMRALLPQLQVVDVPDTNHHTILLSRAGAQQSAAAIRAFTRS